MKKILILLVILYATTTTAQTLDTIKFYSGHVWAGTISNVTTDSLTLTLVSGKAIKVDLMQIREAYIHPASTVDVTSKQSVFQPVNLHLKSPGSYLRQSSGLTIGGALLIIIGSGVAFYSTTTKSPTPGYVIGGVLGVGGLGCTIGGVINIGNAGRRFDELGIGTSVKEERRYIPR